MHEPEIEALPWAEQRRRDDALYRTQVPYLLERSRFYRKKLHEAGFETALMRFIQARGRRRR